MPKFTPLRERVLVAKATGNSAEIERIKREIIDAHRGSVPETAKRIGMHQLTLRRMAEELGIEAELGINRSRGEPSLLLSRARIAVESRDEKAASVLRKQILDAIDRAQGTGIASAAAEMGVSPWVLQKVIDVLQAGGEIERAHPGKYSLLGERILVAQRTNDTKALDRVRSEIRVAFRRAKDDPDAAALALGVTTQTLRKLSRELGLAKELGFEEQNSESTVFTSRVRVAKSKHDRAGLSQIRKEILTAFEESDGMLRRAAKKLSVGEAVLRKVIADLGMKDEIAEKFPGMGKERMLPVRVNGRVVTHSIAEWARLRGIKRTTILARLKAGKSHEEAVSAGDLRMR